MTRIVRMWVERAGRKRGECRRGGGANFCVTMCHARGGSRCPANRPTLNFIGSCSLSCQDRIAHSPLYSLLPDLAHRSCQDRTADLHHIRSAMQSHGRDARALHSLRARRPLVRAGGGLRHRWAAPRHRGLEQWVHSAHQWVGAPAHRCGCGR